MLKPLHPGYMPLGIFDLEDDDHSLVKGGEVGVFQALDETTDAYAADVFQQGPQVHLTLDKCTAAGNLYGLVDEGTSTSHGRGYGTYFGTQIGGAAGQGTGFGAMSTTGAVVIGPSTVKGSGKATLWTMPGLYGVTSDAWHLSAEFDAASLNSGIYGKAADGTYDGKLTTTSTSNGVKVALVVGPVSDASLVSTTLTQAASDGTDWDKFLAIYLTGVQV